MPQERASGPLTTEQAMARLQACQDLLGRIDQSGLGITYQPSERDLTLLHGYEAVANAAAARPDGEGWFDEIRSRAGLAPSSAGLLAGVLHHWYASRLSPAAQIEQLQRALERHWGRPVADE